MCLLREESGPQHKLPGSDPLLLETAAGPTQTGTPTLFAAGLVVFYSVHSPMRARGECRESAEQVTSGPSVDFLIHL